LNLFRVQFQFKFDLARIWFSLKKGKGKVYPYNLTHPHPVPRSVWGQPAHLNASLVIRMDAFTIGPIVGALGAED
jgi:hypothetical protein